MDKALPLVIPPTICWSHNAHILSIVLRNTDALPWFFSNFIQLSCVNTKINPSLPLTLRFYEYYENIEDWFYYALTPQRFIKIEKVFKGTLLAHNVDIWDFIVRNIDLGRYIYTSIDEFYVPMKDAYGAYSCQHDIFIHGYDKQNQQIIVSGFFNYMYQESKIPYEAFLKGFTATNDLDGLDFNPYYSNVYCIEPTSILKSALNFDHIINMLTDFLESKDSSNRYNMFNFQDKSDHNLIYGLKTYDYLINEVEMILLNQKECDIKPFQLLWEHKKIMFARIHFINENFSAGISISTITLCEDLISSSLIMRNHMLKFQVTKDATTIKSLVDQLKHCHDKDQIFTKQFLQEILSWRETYEL